ncbi:MAG: MFS transporter [Lentimicrobiaceae bacterium]|nr:MFS transporter [Lentimicrobiaceae bacterium]
MNGFKIILLCRLYRPDHRINVPLPEKDLKMQGNKSILFVTTLSSFLTPFMGSAINIALPTMGQELNMNTIALGWVSTSYLLAAAVFLLPFGRLADTFGRKRFFLSGLVVFSVGSLLSAFSLNQVILIGSRAINGIGGAMIYATAIAILTSAFPKEERGKVLGINVAAVYLGLSIGPTAGGLLTAYLGWQSIFIVAAALGIIMLPIAVRKLQNDNKTAPVTDFDFKGSFLYAIGLAMVIYGFPEIASINGILMLGLGLALLILFFRVENKLIQPLLNVKIFKGNSVFVFSNLAAFINYSATFALVFLMSFFLQQVKDFDAREAGLILIAQPIMMTIFSPLAGKLSDRIEPRLVASLGMLITVGGLFGFAFLHDSSPLWYIILFQIILGLGFALFSSPNTNAVMSSVKPQQYGFASATLGTMRLTGQTMSMGISLMIISLIMGNANVQNPSGNGLLTSIRLAFLVFAILCLIGVYFSFKRGALHANNN